MRLPDYASAESTRLLILYKLSEGSDLEISIDPDYSWIFNAEIVESISVPTNFDIKSEWDLDVCYSYQNQTYYYIKDN